MIKLQAHRGVSSEYPENTIAAFRASVEEGYHLIEFDLKFTKDEEIVVIHDNTLNRTARTSDGVMITETLYIEKILFSEARSFDYGLWKSTDFKGERIPLLSEALDFAEQTGIPFKIDNCWERFPQEIKNKLFTEIAKREDRINIGFTCSKLETMKTVVETFKNATIHYDGGDLSQARLEEVAQIAKNHPLYIWVCYDNAMTRWFKGTKANKEVCSQVHKYGKLGVWILSKKEELEIAVRDFDADIIETTGHIKPQWLKGVGK